MDRQRYRCFHYSSGGNCDFDLCGDCYNNIKELTETRRSSREPKPKYSSSRDGEWLISPKFQSKRSDKTSPTDKQVSPHSATSGMAPIQTTTSPKRGATDRRTNG